MNAIQEMFFARGYGRSKLFSVEGRTKRDKWRTFVWYTKMIGF